MNFEKTMKNNLAVIIAAGDMTIYEAEPLRQELLAGLRESDGLELNLDGVSVCDAAGLQILLSARNHAVAQNKSFAVTNTSELVRATAEKAGLDWQEWCGSEKGEQQ